MNSLFLCNAKIIFPERIQEGLNVLVQKGRIAQITSSAQAPAGAQLIDLQGAYLSPGFIDLHIHGAVGRDTMDATPQSWEAISRYHAAGGTTSFALTTVTATFGDIRRVLELAANLLSDKSTLAQLGGSRLLGIHLEGPYLSPQKPGAHKLELMRTAALYQEEMKAWDLLAPYMSYVTQISLAPELEGMCKIIEAMRRHHIICSAAHTNATDQEFAKARQAGLDNATHLFNCMSMAHKNGFLREAGVVEAVLANREVYAEIIGDGVHVTPTLVQMAYNAKGADKLTLITDATAGAGLPEGSIFHVGHIPARVYNGYALCEGKEASLAGSTIRMIDAVKTMVEQAQISLSESVRMATLTPATRLGRQKEIGSISVGLKADFCLFSEELRLLQTWRDGQMIFQAL